MIKNSNSLRISNSLDWDEIETIFMHKSIKLSFRSDIQHMIKNIRAEVVELSREEVNARRGKRVKAQELLEKINNDIDLIEGYLLVAALMG